MNISGFASRQRELEGEIVEKGGVSKVEAKDLLTQYQASAFGGSGDATEARLKLMWCVVALSRILR